MHVTSGRAAGLIVCDSNGENPLVSDNLATGWGDNVVGVVASETPV